MWRSSISRVSSRRREAGIGPQTGVGEVDIHGNDSVRTSLLQDTPDLYVLIRDRKWVLDHARNQVITTFHEMRAMRIEAHRNYLQTLPFYTLYHRYNGAPPLGAAQLQLIHSQISSANHTLQQGVDQDWRTACMQYPQVLDYYFSLIQVRLPRDDDIAITDPRFGGSKEPPRRVKNRRESVEYREPPPRDEHRRRERRRSRTGRTPPHAPMPY